MIQGEARRFKKWNQLLNQIGSSAKLIYLSFDKPLPGVLYAPNSTWNTGRNLLLTEAFKTSKKAKYFVALDGDLILNCAQSSCIDCYYNYECWYNFHRLLLEQNDTSQILKPDGGFDGKADYPRSLTCIDLCFLAIPNHLLYLFYPITTSYQTYSWHVSFHVQINIMHMCAKYSVLTLPEFTLWNTGHLKYPRKSGNEHMGNNGRKFSLRKLTKNTLKKDFPSFEWTKMSWFPRMNKDICPKFPPMSTYRNHPRKPYHPLTNYTAAHTSFLRHQENEDREIKNMCRTVLYARFRNWIDSNTTSTTTNYIDL